MKILIVAEVFYPEDFIINDLAKHWVENGYDVSVLTRVPSYPKDKIFEGFKNKLFQNNHWAGIKIYRLPVILGYQSSKFKKVLNYINFVSIGSLFALIKGRQFDQVFIYQTGPLTLALPGILISKIFNKKSTLWTQDLWPDTVYAYGFKKTRLFSFFLNKLVGLIYSSTTNILVSCEGFIEKINGFAPEKKVEWIPNWALTQQTNSKVNLSFPKGFHFLFAGNIGKVQNLENVIKGFEEFVKSNENGYLHIVGDGSNLKTIQQLVSDSKIKNVILYGRKPLREMPDYFSAADVLIISLTNKEIFNLTIPSKFQSYLVAEKPMLGVIGGEVKHLIEHYQIGLCAEPDDIATIKNNMQAFVSMAKPDIYQMQSNAKILYEEKFQQESIINKIDEIIFS